MIEGWIVDVGVAETMTEVTEPTELDEPTAVDEDDDELADAPQR